MTISSESKMVKSLKKGFCTESIRMADLEAVVVKEGFEKKYSDLMDTRFIVSHDDGYELFLSLREIKERNELLNSFLENQTEDKTHRPTQGM